MRAISSVPVTISDSDFVSLYLLKMTLALRRKCTKEVDHLNVIHCFFLPIGNDSLEQESTVCTAGVNVAKVLSLEENNMFLPQDKKNNCFTHPHQLHVTLAHL